jgi:hypothetical protein
MLTQLNLSLASVGKMSANIMKAPKTILGRILLQANLGELLANVNALMKTCNAFNASLVNKAVGSSMNCLPCTIIALRYLAWLTRVPLI